MLTQLIVGTQEKIVLDSQKCLEHFQHKPVLQTQVQMEMASSLSGRNTQLVALSDEISIQNFKAKIPNLYTFFEKYVV